MDLCYLFITVRALSLLALIPIKVFKNLVTCEYISSGSFMLMLLRPCWCVCLSLANTMRLVYNNFSLKGVGSLRQEPSVMIKRDVSIFEKKTIEDAVYLFLAMPMKTYILPWA